MTYDISIEKYTEETKAVKSYNFYSRIISGLIGISFMFGILSFLFFFNKLVSLSVMHYFRGIFFLIHLPLFISSFLLIIYLSPIFWSALQGRRGYPFSYVVLIKEQKKPTTKWHKARKCLIWILSASFMLAIIGIPIYLCIGLFIVL